MGSNKRYAAYYDEQAAKRLTESPMKAKCTLPMQAFGPNEIEWVKGSKPPVWAWISWAEGPATRIAAFATGWNDRVVVVEWNESPGGTRNTVVWRNAVTVRS